MKIVSITNIFSVNGGVGKYTIDLHTALREGGHESFIIHGDPHSNPESKSQPNLFYIPQIDCFPWEAPLRPRNQAALDIVDSIQPDIVHFQNNNNFSLEEEVRKKYPAIKSMHVHSYCPSGTKYHHASNQICSVKTGGLCLPRMVYQRCTLSKRPSTILQLYRQATESNRYNRHFSKIIVFSEFMRQAALQNGFAPGQVETLPYFTSIPSGIDSSLTVPNRIFFNARLTAEKGGDKLIKAMAAISSLSWELWVAGDGPELPRMRKLAQKFGLENRVHFLGWLSPLQMKEQYHRTGLVVVPSVWPEPFGLAGIEAMSYAKPVVAFKVGGIPEWLKHRQSGFLIEPYRLNDLGSAIKDLISQPAKAKEMGENGRNTVRQKFSPEVHVHKLVDLYKKVMESYQFKGEKDDKTTRV